MLSLRLLGGLALEVDGKALPAPGGRCGSLLAWLALHPGMQPRSRVAARLWPDVLDESARRSLRSALLDLRRALGPDVGRYLCATRDEVGLWPLEQVCVDVRAFASAVAEGRLEQALALAQGELLPGFEHDWVYDARDAHREELAHAIECLAADAERLGELPTAIAYTRRLVALDPLAEEHARALIRRLSAAQADAQQPQRADDDQLLRARQEEGGVRREDRQEVDDAVEAQGVSGGPAHAEQAQDVFHGEQDGERPLRRDEQPAVAGVSAPSRGNWRNLPMPGKPSHAAVETLEDRRLFSIVVALGTKNELFTVDSNDPDTVLAKTTVKRGLQRRELILGIDYRPANNQLYGLGSTGRLYRIDAVTGTAS
ncbi:MAG: DUF4394 domain-containing protein, partial [Actinobacteria bacterium]|nr:DUF4394 domain-containing protein [Actinomycetota bacterium]